MPFLSSLLISLYCESVKGVFYTKINISVYGDYFVDIPVKLIGIFIKVK